jgi:ATP-dependent Clp protease ATP-binding subunit ClpA
MPSFAESLEKTLHNALRFASERDHEYAALEHLLLALVDDTHAAEVMTSCGVNLDDLRGTVTHYIDHELDSLKTGDGGDPTPTSGFQRVVQRAILHVQSSGKDEVTGANVLVALFSERESYAVYFLQQQDMSRLDAVSFLSHGVGKGGKAAAETPKSEKDSGGPRVKRRPRNRRSTNIPSISTKRLRTAVLTH